MTRHPTESNLQRHLDGDLPAAERWRMEAHLQECGDCAGRFSALQLLVGGVRRLPDGIEPPTDLWPGIAARIGRGGMRPLTPRPAPRPGYRFARTLGAWGVGLAAALAIGIGLGRTLPRPEIPLATRPVPVSPAGSVAPDAALASYDDPGYQQAVDDLRLVLDSMRDRLQPETIATVEENLAIIDQAIADSRAALLADPANDHLHRHLATSMQKKLDLLRMVTRAFDAQI